MRGKYYICNVKTQVKDINASDSRISNDLGVISGLTNPEHFNL